MLTKQQRDKTERLAAVWAVASGIFGATEISSANLSRAYEEFAAYLDTLTAPEGCVSVPLPLLKSALQALEESIGYVEHDYATNWRHGLPSREGQLNAMLIELTNHRDAIRLLKEWIEPGDSNE